MVRKIKNFFERMYNSVEMPFKTRKHKLSAASRRITFSDSGLVSYDERPKVGVKITKDSEKTLSNKNIEDLSYVKPAILKIVLAASIIIGLQLAMSLTLP
jgi:hypothetical protein